MGTAALRLTVVELGARFPMKKRRACRVVGLAPSTLYYESRRPERAEIRARLRELAAQRPRWGCRRLHVVLHRQGHQLNHKLVLGGIRFHFGLPTYQACDPMDFDRYDYADHVTHFSYARGGKVSQVTLMSPRAAPRMAARV